MIPHSLAISLLGLLGFLEPDPASAPLQESLPLPTAVTREVSFTKDVQPILARACWSCHGSQTWESGLRLDRKERMLQGGDGGAVIKVGQSAESRLIHFVSGAVPDKQMPPDDDPLTAEDIGILRAWIDQGLDWPASATTELDPAEQHWAFQPIRRPVIPSLETAADSEHPVDRFIAAALETQGIAPSARANRSVLMRRLSLDLVGLLPSPAEVAAFVADERPDAYERLVDRLLANPHFGERWGRHWLDLARYADSDGYEKDLARPFAYRYRDWVISAFNADLPFDQLTIDQLAGDLVPQPTLDQQLATGFHRQTLTNREGGIDPREDRDKQLVDRTNTTGAVWLGLTVGCAQCHTHKYDPISQREYFQLYAFFNAAREVEISAPTPLEAERYAALQATHSQARLPLVEAIETYRRTRLATQQAAWEQRLHDEPIAWTVPNEVLAKSESKAQLTLQDDQSWLVSGATPDVDTYTLTLPCGLTHPSGLLLETLPHASLPATGPGRAPNGNFVLTEVKAAWRPTGEPQAKLQPLRVASGQADYVQAAGTPRAFSPEKTFDGDAKTGWAVGGSSSQPHALLVEFDWTTKVPIDQEITLEVTLEQRYGGQHLLGAFRLLTTTAARPLALPQSPEHVNSLLAVAPGERTAEQQQQLSEYYAKIDPDLVALEAQLKAFDATGPQPPATKAMAFAELEQPAPAHIHLRGDFLTPGDVVEPAVFTVLNPLSAVSATPNRLDLARWLVSEDHPLTRRVAVNRIWQHLFGRGLVDPPDDFGLRGTPPTHPELLDWLASEFLDRGWSVKSMVKLLVTSAAYQRDSVGRPDLADIDPKNLLLSRQNRFRLTGEILRDLNLEVSGLLDERIGGPSIRPPLPAGVADLGYAGSVKWKESDGADRYRRGCYIFFQRTVPYPLLMTFDGPDSNVTCQRRERSNTPLQSLTLLNDPAFVECARVLGLKLHASGGASLSDRLRSLVVWTLAREPDEDELGVLAGLHAAAVERFRQFPAEAVELSGVAGATAETIEEAAWITLARMVLNLDEFLTRE